MTPIQTLAVVILTLGVASALDVHSADASSYFHWKFLNVAIQSRTDPGYKAALDVIENSHTPLGNGKLSHYTWNCETFPSAAAPTNVHELTPPDIGVVAALGDSITAGNGIADGSIVEVAIERRGASWSIGRDEDIHQVVTIANVLAEYNTELYGGSTGSGPRYMPGSNLNVAEPGAKSHDMEEQAIMLVDRLSQEPEKMENEWKLVTLFIGGNDICDQCHNRDTYRGVDYANRIALALDYLYANLPKAFVSVVPILDMTALRYMSRGLLCDQMQREFCDCVVNRDTMDETRPIQLDYYQELDDLVDSGNYDGRDDFALVMQPMWVNQEFPHDDEGNYDDSWVSVDCFHPNRKTHEFMAVTLWNTLFVPDGQKPMYTEGIPAYHCPVQGETLKTRFNSAAVSKEERIAKVAKGFEQAKMPKTKHAKARGYRYQ